jgi:predicted nuclease of predicted toxin-antitoxin system
VAKLYADEQFPYRATFHLQAIGHDVLTVQAAGRANQSIPDDEVLAFATAESRAVLTLNRRDFVRLHRESQDHAGIITCTDDADKLRLAERIDAAIQLNPTLAGQLIRVVKPSL